MALIDRLDPANENRSISFHEFSAGISKVTDGDWSLVVFKTRFELDATDDSQLNQLVARYQSLPVEEKRGFYIKVEREGVLWETGRQTKAEFIAALGMS